MPEKAAVTVDASAVTQDDTYTYFGLPEGHYDASSKVRATNSNIKPQPHTGVVYWWGSGSSLTAGRAVVWAPYSGYYTLRQPYETAGRAISFIPYGINFGIKTYLGAGSVFGYDIQLQTAVAECTAIYDYTPI